MTKPTFPKCSTCNSPDILLDALAVWDETRQEAVVETVLDKGHYCQTCNSPCTIEWEEYPNNDPAP